MAVEHIFDTTYYARRGDKANAVFAKNAYRVIIGSTAGTVSVSSTSELQIYDPGLTLKWDGDQDRFTNAIMGATLSFTIRMEDDQLTTWEQMLDLPEGDVFCLLFNDLDDGPYWYGHLVIEDCSIRVENEYHRVDVTFTDGLAALRGKPWRNDGDDLPYTGFKKLTFYLREIANKLPGFTAFKDYHVNYLDEDSVPIIRELGMPTAVTGYNGSDYDYDERDFVLDKCRVRADSFNVPKRQTDRFRELEAAPDYLNTADVLEDICKTFGATACIFGGFLNLGCRHDIATLGGSGVWAGEYYYDAVADSWTLTNGGYSLITRDTEADDHIQFLSGAVRKRTLPIAQVNLTHEEGGSDYLAAYGYFVNPNISFVNLDNAFLYQSFVQASGGGSMSIQGGDISIDGIRDDLFLNFRNSTNEAPVPVVDLPFYKSHVDRTGYLGFEPTTTSDLELASGESIRVNFGGNVKLSHPPPRLQQTSDRLVGSVLIARFRVQFTTTDDVGYRLSRTVHTHVSSNGSQDYITIEEGITSAGDKAYFRKLYNEVEWLKDDHADYDDDGWFEVIIPHGDSDNSGDGYGATLYPLTQEYDGQLSYAPIGTKIKGDNDGAGVILKEVGAGSGTWHYWFRDVLDFELPYGDNDATLSFEEFYIEMGFSLFKPQNGPRPNYTGPGGVGNYTEWSNENPTWRSENADGTGSVGTPPSTEATYGESPDYIHMTGLRVTQGDGSETSDLVTKVTGGDGYEILNLGSSRLGSRIAYSNTHINNVLELKVKDGFTIDDFVSPEEFTQKCKWKGHRGPELSAIPNTEYDSLHGYVAESFLEIFGQTIPYYSLSIKPKNVTGGSNSYMMLKNPFMCILTDQLRDDKSEQEVLMPMSYTWTMNEGVQGEFLVVGKERNLDTTILDYTGRPSRGFGGVIGLPTGVDVIRPVFQSRNVTNNITIDEDSGEVTGITVNTGSTVFDADKVSQGTTNKFGTATQFAKVDHLTVSSDTNLDTLRDNVADNNDKVSFPGFGRTANLALEGDTPTIQDIQELPQVARDDGVADPVTVIAENPELLTLVVESDVAGYTGLKQFTVQQMFQGIVQGGLQDMENDGYIADVADYEGTTSGVLGDFNDDGSVGSADLLDFLVLYGTVYVGDNGAFSSTEVPIDNSNYLNEMLSFYDATDVLPQYFNWDDADVGTVVTGGVSVNTYGSDETPANTVEFVSGTNPQYPITSWTQKKVVISAKGNTNNPHFYAQDSVAGQEKKIVANVRTFDSSGTLLQEQIRVIATVVSFLPGSKTYSWTDVFGAGVSSVVDVPLAGSDIEKIQVRLGVAPSSLDDTLFNFGAIRFTVKMQSVTS